MAYNRRNDNDGRVIGFKDGMPVYKRGGNKPAAPKRERKPRFNDRDRDGEYDSAGDYSGKRNYNRKDEPRRDGKRRDEAPRKGNPEGRSYGGRTEGFRRGPSEERSYGGRDEGFRRDRMGYREGSRSDRVDRYSRPERRSGDQSRPRRGDNPVFEEHPIRMQDGRAPRERKQYENFKPLPADIPPTRENAEPEELPNIIMGRNPVKEAIKSGRSIDRILVTKEHDGSLNEILDLARDAKLVVRDVDRQKLDEICMPFGHNGRSGNHQGIIAYIPGAEYCELSDILDYAAEKGEAPFVILLDGIEDPHNLGSIIRSAECAGAHGVVITKRRSASVTAAVVKTSAGATEHMRIAKVVNLAVAIERLKEAGVWVAGADMDGEPVYKADLRGPFALVIGAEGAGVSHLVKEKCDFTVSIPLKGEIGSLNASVAAAVVMFEKVRQELV